jgi:hypothetical protein
VDWETVYNKATSYIEDKQREGRYDRHDEAVPTWDLLENREVIA